MNDLAQRYNKEIVIAETAYPWTLDWYDNTNNIVSDTSQLLPEYPVTMQGQKEFLINLMNIVSILPNDLGSGFFIGNPIGFLRKHSDHPGRIQHYLILQAIF